MMRGTTHVELSASLIVRGMEGDEFESKKIIPILDARWDLHTLNAAGGDLLLVSHILKPINELCHRIKVHTNASTAHSAGAEISARET